MHNRVLNVKSMYPEILKEDVGTYSSSFVGCRQFSKYAFELYIFPLVSPSINNLKWISSVVETGVGVYTSWVSIKQLHYVIVDKKWTGPDSELKFGKGLGIVL